MLLGMLENHWKKFKSLNKNSIGIEINNPGHDHLNIKNFQKNKFEIL